MLVTSRLSGIKCITDKDTPEVTDAELAWTRSHSLMPHGIASSEKLWSPCHHSPWSHQSFPMAWHLLLQASLASLAISGFLLWLCFLVLLPSGIIQSLMWLGFERSEKGQSKDQKKVNKPDGQGRHLHSETMPFLFSHVLQYSYHIINSETHVCRERSSQIFYL